MTELEQKISFISQVCKLHKKNTPNFTKLAHDEVLKLYAITLISLNDTLMRSRQIPIDPAFLDGLYKLSFPPKSTAIILNSMRNE